MYWSSFQFSCLFIFIKVWLNIASWKCAKTILLVKLWVFSKYQKLCMARPFKVGRLQSISQKLHCSNHFKEGDISQGKRPSLKKNATPLLFANKLKTYKFENCQMFAVNILELSLCKKGNLKIYQLHKIPLSQCPPHTKCRKLE